MKKLITYTLLLLVVIACPLSIKAQTMGPADNLSVGFGGVKYDKGVMVTIGTGTNVLGDVWIFKYAEVGSYYGSLAAEVVVFYHFPESPWSLGAIAGPSADWLNTAEDGESPLAYISGALGGVISYQFSPKWGVSIHAKYKGVGDLGATKTTGAVVGAVAWIDI